MGGVKRPKSTSHTTIGADGGGMGQSLTALSGSATLEDRWAALSASLQEMESGGRAEGSHHIGAGSGGSSGSADGMKPSSSALLVLIEQALQSGDDSLLEQGLACDDIPIIQATVRKIATTQIVKFVRKLVSKYEKQPYRR